MLFNKANKGNEELRLSTGSYYKSNEFDKINIQVELSSDDLIALIGQDIYDLAEEHYLGEEYQIDEATDEQKLLDKLVNYMQAPIAFLATLWHYQGNDLSHEGQRAQSED